MAPIGIFTTASDTNSLYFTNLWPHEVNNPFLVSWNTNVSSSNLLEYGLDSNYGTVVTNTSVTTSHSLTLNNLNPGSIYHYRFKGVVQGGPQLVSPDMIFTFYSNTITAHPPTTSVAATTTIATTATTTTATTGTTTATTTTATTATTAPTDTTTSATTTATNTTATTPSVTTATTPSITTVATTFPTTPIVGNGNSDLSVDQSQLNFRVFLVDINNGNASKSLRLSGATALNWSALAFTSSGGDWLSVSPRSGNLSDDGSGHYVSNLTVSVKNVNLAAGTYSGGIFINNLSYPAQPVLIVAVNLVVTDAVTPVPTTTATPPDSSFNYYLPYLSNGDNGFTNYLTLQNQSASWAAVTISYFGSNGQFLHSDSNSAIGAGAQWSPTNGFSVGASGNAKITSSQPLNIVVSEGTPSGGSAFLLNRVTGSKLVAPLMLRRAFGGFSTDLYLLNTADQATNIKVSYYSADGSLIKTQNASLAAHASASLDQTDAILALPNSFAGWATLDAGTNSSIAAQVLESNPGMRFTATFGAVAAPYTSPVTTGTSTTLYAPAIFNGAFGSFYSGMNLVNPNGATAQVTVAYYDPTSGSAIATQKFTIGAYASQSIYHGDPAVGLPARFFGSALITSDQPLSGVVNENGGGSDSGTYTLLSSGGQQVNLPVVANGAYGGYISGLPVLNLTDRAVAFTLQYYDGQGNATGTPHRYSLSPHGSQPIYQGAITEALPNGFFGTCLLSADTPSSLAVTTNVANNQLKCNK